MIVSRLVNSDKIFSESCRTGGILVGIDFLFYYDSLRHGTSHSQSSSRSRFN
ncbi:MAG: hypothetical protein KatS3mg083_071 [Candidatus Dojkabacteria bacterium]|nr:MAG: hypothetical protein KatS3mg083_071 [Candidatus Dojkabacteria bacterium]